MKCVRFCAIMLIFFISTVTQSEAAPQVYVPSYDDRYEEDMRQALNNKNHFNEPADELNYAHYHYVGAHGAEKYPRFFPEYALQEQPIIGLLAIGVRGLMISVYNWSLSWSSIIREGISIVCSNPKEESKVFRKNGKPLYQTLHYEMNRIFNFLKSHPQAVITILFDDYADTAKISRDMKEIIMKNSYDPLLKPSDWPNASKKGEWPTLGWMRKNNKRLVLFTQTYDQYTDVTWPVRYHFWENVYGTVDRNIVCSEERESSSERYKKNRALVSFNCFGSVAVSLGARDSKRCLDYQEAKDLIDGCRKKKFAQGKLFNCYWVDHVIDGTNVLTGEGKKTVFDYVNELNTQERK